MVKRHKATFSASGTFEVAPAKHLKEIDSLFDPFTKHLGTFSNRSFCNKGSVFTYQKNKNPKLKLKTPKSKFLETIFFSPHSHHFQKHRTWRPNGPGTGTPEYFSLLAPAADEVPKPFSEEVGQERRSESEMYFPIGKWGNTTIFLCWFTRGYPLFGLGGSNKQQIYSNFGGFLWKLVHEVWVGNSSWPCFV